MKYLSLVIILTITTFAVGQKATRPNLPDYIGESEHYRFYSHFWFNMHHFLHQEALTLELSKKSKISPKRWNRLSDADKKKLTDAINYYRKNLLDKDLRFSEYMSEFKAWVIRQPKSDLAIPDKFKDHAQMLVKAKGAYNDVFWQSHDLSNKKVWSDNLPLIKSTEKDVVKKLSALTKQFWQEDKIRVDLTFYAKSTRRNQRNLPYTSLDPTHVVMPSEKNTDDPKGNWLELLYHESSHNLIGSRSGFVGGTIIDIAEATGEKAPRNLWHAYLFYFSGVVTQQVLKTQGVENYELYMVRRNVFSSYIPHMKKYLTSYMNHKSTLKDVTELIFQDVKKKN